MFNFLLCGFHLNQMVLLSLSTWVYFVGVYFLGFFHGVVFPIIKRRVLSVGGGGGRGGGGGLFP